MFYMGDFERVSKSSEFFSLPIADQNDQIYGRFWHYAIECRKAESSPLTLESADARWIAFNSLLQFANDKIFNPEQLLAVADRFLKPEEAQDLETNKWRTLIGLSILHSESVIHYFVEKKGELDSYIKRCDCYTLNTDDVCRPRTIDRYNFIQANEALLQMMQTLPSSDEGTQKIKAMIEQLEPRQKQVLIDESTSSDMEGSAVQKYYGKF